MEKCTISMENVISFSSKHPNFADGIGLDVHIQTTSQNFLSYIEEVAVKAGSYIANINTEGVWIDIELLTDFPTQYDHFQVTRKHITNKKGNNIVTYNISAAGYKAVQVKIPGDTKFVFVAVVCHSHFPINPEDNFGTSQDLMGQYGTDKTLGCDGLTEFDDMNTFGMEWQVQSHEDMLFLTVHEPHFPSVCNMPVKQSDVKHILAENPELCLEAEQACDHADAEMIEFCVQDVIATGDLSNAAGY